MKKYYLIGLLIFTQGYIGQTQIEKAPFKADEVAIKGRTLSLQKNLNLKPSKELIPYFFSSDNEYDDVMSVSKDENGVVLEEGLYKPTFIFRSGMNAYRYYIKNNDKVAFTHFMNQVRWLKQNFKVLEGKYGLWFWSHPKESYNLNENWTSALSHGMGIGLSLMAYHETGDRLFLEIIEKALKAYVIPVENGGFFRYWGLDVWFEEYPTENPSRVMNGFIFSLAGLYNLYANTGNELALWLFNEGVLTLKKNIDIYDADFISKYSLFQSDVYWPGWAKKTYHKLHILQMLWLYDISEEEVFYDKAKKFLEVQKSIFEEYTCNIERVLKVSANSQIAGRAPSNVYDNQWSWGGIWASKSNNPELIFQMAAERYVYGFSLYHNSEESSALPFEVYVSIADSELHKVQNLTRLHHFVHPSGKKRVTYIDVYEFTPLKGREVHFKFFNQDGNQSVQITEADIFSDLKEETECLFESIRKQRKDDIAIFK